MRGRISFVDRRIRCLVSRTSFLRVRIRFLRVCIRRLRARIAWMDAPIAWMDAPIAWMEAPIADDSHVHPTHSCAHEAPSSPRPRQRPCHAALRGPKEEDGHIHGLHPDA